MGLIVQTTGIIVRGLVRSKFIPWQDIAGISYTQEHAAWLPAWRTAEAYLWLRQGGLLSLGSLVPDEKLPECVTRLKAEMYTILETACRHTLQIGEAVHFGPIRIQKTGLNWGGLFGSLHYGWRDIEKIDVVHGQLVLILTEGRKKHFSICKIPNFEIFLILLREAEKSNQ